MVTAETMKCKPVEEGIIFLTETEFKEYVDLLAQQNSSVFSPEEIEQRKSQMLTGKRPATFFKWEVKCRPN